MTNRARIATFKRNNKLGYGAITDTGVVDLSARYGDTYPSLRDVIEACALPELVDAAMGQPDDFGLDEISFEIPIQNPEKLICVGVNFPNRNEEYKDGQAAPPNPSLFIRFPRSFTGHDQPLVRPTRVAAIGL